MSKFIKTESQSVKKQKKKVSAEMTMHLSDVEVKTKIDESIKKSEQILTKTKHDYYAGKVSIEGALERFRQEKLQSRISDVACPLFEEPRLKEEAAMTNEEEPEHFKVDENGWTQVRGVMDSGASKSVCQPHMAPHYSLQESVGSKSGRAFKCAGKTSIPNLGQKHFDIMSLDESVGKARYQVADISRPLNSVSEICDGGGRHGPQVTFGRTGGVIYNLDTGKETYFEREEGIYILELWIPPQNSEYFRRPGQ